MPLGRMPLGRMFDPRMIEGVKTATSKMTVCQLLDRIYPGKVPLSKVNWDAKLDYEFLANYKVLQNAFTKLKIDKQLPVERLVRAKYQDNLEFMQWFKRFYELNNPALDYDPANEERRPDRFYLWENLVYPPTMRFLEKAFPKHNWTKYEVVRPRQAKWVLPGQLGFGIGEAPAPAKRKPKKVG